MRIALLIFCVALASAQKVPSKRGIGAEAFAKPQSQDTSSSLNIQALINQLAPQGYPAPYDQYGGYQAPYLAQPAGYGLTELGGFAAIPPQVAPQQKPEQLALAAAAAVAQQNFGNPAYGAPPPRQDPRPALLQTNPLFSNLPQYREYEQQVRDYVSQPIALNFGNTQIRAFPPPRQPQQQQINTFQAYGQQAASGQGYYAQQAPDLFRPAPGSSSIPYVTPQPEVAVRYATPQPLAVQYSAPSYGLQDDKARGGAYSYASFASGNQLTTASGFRPIHV